jgi:hypothetical protein
MEELRLLAVLDGDNYRVKIAYRDHHEDRKGQWVAVLDTELPGHHSCQTRGEHIRNILLDVVEKGAVRRNHPIR